MKPGRRQFLGQLAAGGAVIGLPAFLAGCGVVPAVVTPESPPDNPFLEWFGIDERTLARTLARLAAGGAEVADLYFQHSRSHVLGMEDGVAGTLQSDIEQGAGMRVIRAGASGFAWTEDLSATALAATAARAAAGGSAAPPAEAPSRFDPAPAGRLYADVVPWSSVARDARLAVLERADAAARAADPSVSRVSLHMSDSDERILVATLDGALVTDRRPMTRLSLQVTVTRNGSTYEGYASTAARAGLGWYTPERIAALAAEATESALQQFDARQPPAAELPVVLSAGSCGIVLHEAIGHALEADFVADGSSPYAGRRNERIADAQVTIVDDGTLANERGSLNYDDEGLATRRNVLVERGMFRSVLHDRQTAVAAGAAATGTGRRESFRHAPLPRMTCTWLDNGPHEREELVASLQRGIVADTIAGGQVRIGAGGFTFHVRNGWLVEGGRPTVPLRDIELSGDGPGVLAGIDMVANDCRMDGGGWTCGKRGQRVPVSQGMPSVRVTAMGVAPLG